MENQQDRITKRYNELSKEFSDPISQSGYFVDNVAIEKRVFDAWIDRIQQKFNVNRGDYFLDVGCGSGIFLNRFSEYTDKLYGIDPAVGLLESARKNCPGAILEKGTATDIPFKGIKFDRIFCNSVFLYLDSLQHAQEVIEYFISLISSNGKIWLGDLAYPNPEVNDEHFRRKEKSTGWMLQHYPIDFLEKICKDIGVKGTYLKQDVEGKFTSRFRYDFLIEKGKK